MQGFHYYLKMKVATAAFQIMQLCHYTISAMLSIGKLYKCMGITSSIFYTYLSAQ